jgi:excisionase family DNA binding protein
VTKQTPDHPRGGDEPDDDEDSIRQPEAVDPRDAATWPEILTLDEVAHILGVTVRTVRRQVARGLIPAVKSGATYRTRKSDLLAAFTPTNTKHRREGR